MAFLQPVAQTCSLIQTILKKQVRFLEPFSSAFQLQLLSPLAAVGVRKWQLGLLIVWQLSSFLFSNFVGLLNTSEAYFLYVWMHFLLCL